MTRRSLPFTVLLACAGLTSLEMPVHAGGGPENLLLVVNPIDEGALRVANAYVAARHVPINNIIYITPPNYNGYYSMGVTTTDFTNLYQTPILNYIASHGLSQQIDYISTFGQPYGAPNTAGNMCLQDGLNQLTQLKNGMTQAQIIYRGSSELFQDPELPNNLKFTYTPGTNTAIHHSQILPAQGVVGAGQSTVQWYMSGTIGQWGENGISASQTIQSLLRTIPGDGKKVPGTIYFENSTDVRAATRSPYWPAIQSYLSARGIPWIQEESNFNGGPVGMENLRGCEIGGAGYNLPASTYLPGAWSDDLTSDGAAYGGNAQTKVVDAILAGNGGSSGTVAEPLADPNRFPYASVWAYQADGSTLGESFYKSMLNPDLILFHGDLLSQAYADVPAVTFNTAPANGSTVSGLVSITASASLNSPTYATGISHLELFADGIDTGTTVSGNSGTMAWDSTQATDGIHELRVVAYNNSQAASEGFNLVSFVVNNSGESVSITGPGSYNIPWNGSASIPVSATQGTGPAISSVQLQLLGLVLGSSSGSSGSIPINASQLAFGANVITPVANLASGKQVFGAPITITRQFHQLRGGTVTPLALQSPGLDFFYYANAAGNTLASTNFSGKPTNIIHASNLSITPSSTTPSAINMPNAFRTTTGGANKGLAIQVKAHFNITQAGEYAFWGTAPSGSQYTSGATIVDGITLTSFDVWNGSTFVTSFGDGQQLDQTVSIYLLPGEHTLTLQLVQAKGVADNVMAYTLFSRGLTEGTVIPAAPTYYTVKAGVGQ